MSIDLADIAALDIEQWLSENAIDYHKRGDELQLDTCAFCGGKDKVSFSIKKAKGHCFHGSCGRNFNLFSFVRQHLDMDTKTTFRYFEDYIHKTSIRSAKEIVPIEDRIADDWQMPDSIALPTPEGNTHPFLIERRITLESQELFGLRWCEKGFFPFQREGEQKYMPFHGRILIPVADLDGKIHTFQGRATFDTDKRYMFPPDLPGTGRFIYGGNLAKGKAHLIACEGPFDCIAVHQAIAMHEDHREMGAVATFGLSIGRGAEDGNDQLSRIRKLKRMGLERWTFMYDGEKAAYSRAVENAGMIRAEGIKTFIAELPAGADPSELSKGVPLPTAAVRRAINNAEELTNSNYAYKLLANPY